MKALVTGGGGFLGSAIVRRLLDRGIEVRNLTRSRTAWLDAAGVETIQADLTDREQVLKACEGCDAVFHVAAKAGVWGSLSEYARTNVDGTVNVIEGCRQAGVTKLIYTSSPSVVHSGTDMENADESVPYPLEFEAPYPRTKAAAERKVLAENDDKLATVALRPHLIWGPGDNHLVPRIIAKAKTGRLRKIGSKPCKVDSTYIDNAADAHLLAFDRLQIHSRIAGKAYFIANDEPMPVWDLINKILEAADVPPITKTVPVSVAMLTAAAMENAYLLTGRNDEPPMTRFMVKQLSTSHWFNLSAAKRDLGYVPTVSIEEGLRRLRESFRS